MGNWEGFNDLESRKPDQLFRSKNMKNSKREERKEERKKQRIFMQLSLDLKGFIDPSGG